MHPMELTSPLLPSLKKKTEAYIEERGNIKNPFHPSHDYTDRPSVSAFAKSERPRPLQREAGQGTIETIESRKGQEK